MQNECDHEWKDVEDRSDPTLYTVLELKGQVVERAQRCARCGQIQIIPRPTPSHLSHCLPAAASTP